MWPHAYFILINPKQVKCLVNAQLKAHRSFASDCGHYLNKRTELKLGRELIVRFGQLAKRFFAGV